MVAVSVLPPIEEEFVSAGEAQVEARTVAILGEGSELAAQAAECALDQGQFWPYREALFLDGGGQQFTQEALRLIAERLEMDTAAFNECLASGKYAERVRAATAEARSRGVDSVPTILVNGREVPRDVTALRAAIEEELASER